MMIVNLMKKIKTRMMKMMTTCNMMMKANNILLMKVKTKWRKNKTWTMMFLE